MKTSHLDELIRLAFDEDVGEEDVTSSLLIDRDCQARAEIISKGEGILCGLFLIDKIFSWQSSNVGVQSTLEDGSQIHPGDVICSLQGNLRDILRAERVALNFLGRLSGISTHANLFVKTVEGLNVDIMDTRKTTPGLRFLEKYAVKIGGGKNHRFGLYDAILVKENHLISHKTITDAVSTIKKNIKKKMPIEVEVTNLSELKEALEAHVDIVLLDNFSQSDVRDAVSMANGNCLLEVSGGVSLKNVRQFAETGVNRISIGALTHSSPQFDFSLLVREVNK